VCIHMTETLRGAYLAAEQVSGLIGGLQNYLMEDASMLAVATDSRVSGALVRKAAAGSQVDMKPEGARRRMSVPDIDSVASVRDGSEMVASPRGTRRSSFAASSDRGSMKEGALSLAMLKSFHQREAGGAPPVCASVDGRSEASPTLVRREATNGHVTRVAPVDAAGDAQAQQPEDDRDMLPSEVDFTINEALYQRWGLPPAWSCEACHAPCLRYDKLCMSIPIVLHPLSRFSMLWDLMLGIVGLWAMVEVPLMMVYDESPTRYQAMLVISAIFTCTHVFLETRTLGIPAAARTQQLLKRDTTNKHCR
jgi:hypothetical protein